MDKKYKCMWKITYERNQRGKGTSFEKGNTSLACYECDGLQLGKRDCYFSIELSRDMRKKESEIIKMIKEEKE